MLLGLLLFGLLGVLKLRLRNWNHLVTIFIQFIRFGRSQIFVSLGITFRPLGSASILELAT